MSNSLRTLFGRNVLDTERFRGEDGGALADGPLPAYEPSPEELAEMERESAELEAAYAAEAEATAAQERSLREPANAIKFLNEAHGGDDLDGECPAPVEVLSVESASIGSTTTRMSATVRCADGTTRKVDASLSYFSGSFEEPPDMDVSYEYAKEG